MNLRICIIIVLIGTLIIGCKGRKPTPGVSETEILIGNVQDLSGPMKELGFLLPAGANLYFQHINEQGGIYGRIIKMLVEDHQYNPQKAVTAVKKLIEKDQVFCLYQVIGTSPCEAVVPLLNEYAIPLVAPATQSGTMSKPLRKYIFHTDTGYDKQINILIDYILEQDVDAKIGLIYQDDDYGENVLKGATEAESRHRATIQKEAYQRGATDFAGQVGNLMRGGATYVIIAGVVKEPIIIMKTAAAIGFKPQFLGLSPTMDHRVALAAGPAGEGYIAANFIPLWDSDKPGPKLYRELHEKYAEPKTHPAGMYSYYGFATAMVLVEALKNTGKDLTRARFMRTLNSLDYQGGAFPNFKWTRTNHGSSGSVVLVQLKQGKQVEITDWID